MSQDGSDSESEESINTRSPSPAKRLHQDPCIRKLERVSSADKPQKLKRIELRKMNSYDSPLLDRDSVSD